ncbi:hypothetical protein MTO96_030419 [Rhipicephalus appendiculatus]
MDRVLEAVKTRRRAISALLASLLVILSGFCVLETLTITAGQHTLTRFVHAGLKVAVSGAAAVTFCYTAETFPTAVRNVGISLAHLAGGVGNVVAIAVILVTEQHAGHVFYALSTFMVLLSVAAIQWLPEVYVERPPRAGSVSSLSVPRTKSGTRSIAELWYSEPQAQGKQNEIFGCVLTVNATIRHYEKGFF